jgi:hypothetical protein
MLEESKAGVLRVSDFEFLKPAPYLDKIFERGVETLKARLFLYQSHDQGPD